MVGKLGGKKRRSENQKQVDKDRSENRRLDDSDLVIFEGDDEKDQLDEVAEADVENGAHRVPGIAGNLLRNIREQGRQRHDRKSVEDEDEGRVDVENVGDIADGHEDEQKVKPRSAQDRSHNIHNQSHLAVFCSAQASCRSSQAAGQTSVVSVKGGRGLQEITGFVSQRPDTLLSMVRYCTGLDEREVRQGTEHVWKSESRGEEMGVE